MVVEYEDGPLAGSTRLLRNIYRSHRLPAGFNWEDADHGRPLDRPRCNLKRSADHPRSIVHDVQAHAWTVSPVFYDSGTVIVDQQCTLLIRSSQANQDVARVTMLEGVVHCFLSDMVKMRGPRIVVY